MYAVLLTAALLTADDQKAAPPAAGAVARAAADANVNLDGNWTVITLEKNGQPVREAKNAMVMVKGNVATFKKADGTEDKGMRAMRLDFGRNGTLFVAEANADGKFEATGADRRDNPADRRDAPPAGGARAEEPTKFPAPPTAADQARRDGSKAGVYVLTSDYLAVCIHEDGAKPGASPVTDRPATDRTGGIAPQAKSYCTVILKRADAQK